MYLILNNALLLVRKIILLQTKMYENVSIPNVSHTVKAKPA